ncbi:sugar ABC transporter substrate-binding protein [Metabacillus litoralis]|uniref:ABC transporter substrate-binding protein n=1 Tax=Metabacillus litoralis TaxID=152268 RepID=UPI000EF5A31E|nr:sugar ABC transporter substrate-binding protein [Metabacillus litoralis]UHA59691.1 sugar ABC transporter substrate-binding protein [Metabacillus litoralis]
MVLEKMKAFLIMLLSAFLIIGIVGCSSGETTSNNESNGEGSNEKQVEIRFSWWGDTKRNEVYNAIVDRFEEEHPNIKVKREFGGWTDYWDRLATQTAGGNAPDVVSMHQFYVSDYARRNALLNLNEYVDAGKINLENFPESTTNSGKVGDDLFMVAKGVTMSGWVYNTALFDKLGVEYPNMDWTWEDFQEKVKEIHKASNGEIWGSADMSGGQLQPNLRYFLRQKGKDLFDDEGKIAFTKEDVIEWWTMWDNLRKEGAIPDAATSTEYEGAPLEQNLFVTGKTAIQQLPANQIYLYQQQFNEGEIQIVRMPHIDGGENGEYIEGAYLSITEKSEHPEEAAMFIDFFVNAEKALELFKVEQGAPGSTEMQEFVKPLLDPAQQRAVEFIQKTVEYGEPAPYAPLGVNEVEQAFKDNASAISFGQKTVAEAAEDFMNTAEGILK